MDPFRFLFEQRQRSAIAAAQRIVGNRAEAEEVAQDAFLEVWRRAGERGIAPDPAWVTTTVRCRAIDRIRRRRTAVTINRDLANAPPPSCNTEFDRAENHADEGAVLAALRELSVAQREAIDLVYLESFAQRSAATRSRNRVAVRASANRNC